MNNAGSNPRSIAASCRPNSDKSCMKGSLPRIFRNVLFELAVWTALTVSGFSFSAAAEEINYLPQSENTNIVKHKYYTLSYVERYKDPEWVAYKLEDYMIMGGAKRSNKFRSDPHVPNGSALPLDYTKSGYDRGHLCPAADMKWNAEAMDETFYMSNMAPQEPGFNRGIWKKLEEQVREWAIEMKKIYVVTGLVLNDGLPTIGKVNRVSVPKYLYKIVLQYDGRKSKAIAFLMPNESSSSSLTAYIVPIDSIESLTRIDFFPSLSAELGDGLEKHINISNWRFIARGPKKNITDAVTNGSSDSHSRRPFKTSTKAN